MTEGPGGIPVLVDGLALGEWGQALRSNLGPPSVQWASRVSGASTPKHFGDFGWWCCSMLPRMGLVQFLNGSSTMYPGQRASGELGNG